jgi:hypothetical protein
MRSKIAKVEFIIGGGVTVLLGFLVLALLIPTLSYYDFPNCNPSPFEKRRQILEEIPYVHGNVRQITDSTLTIESDFRYLNRWKCQEMRSPYQEVVGSLTKEYIVRITPETQIVPIGDPRYQFVPNDHRPEFLPEPKKILEEIDSESQSQISLHRILRDNRIVVVSDGEPALTSDTINASLIMVDPHRAGLYSFGMQMTIFLSVGLIIGTIITILSQFLYQITQQSRWIFFSTLIKSGGATAFIIWYLIQLT